MEVNYFQILLIGVTFYMQRLKKCKKTNFIPTSG